MFTIIEEIISVFLALSTLPGYSFSYGKTYEEADYGSKAEVAGDMEKYAGVFSEVKDCGGVPALYINGQPFTSVAYMTYLEQFNEYGSFAEAGYNFFSAPVLFAGRWINATADTPAFKKGIFDTENSPDFSLFDETVKKILEQCPDAYIFPRVNVSLPEWWEKENPDDVNIREDGTSCRESMYSSEWREDVSQMLREFVAYVNSSEYAPHIVGCQIAGGNTEEWFHFDLNAGYCRNAEKGFNEFLEKYYPGSGFSGLPDLSKLNRPGVFHNDEHLAKFLEYASFAVADAITDFAAVVKQETGGNVVVGTFYGYSLEVTNPLYGVHALKVLLNDKNIDFICSPCSYIGTRDSGSDWTEMFPADSVRLHGKMKAAATCTENGVTTYTAEFENELFEAQSQDKDDIAALSHSFTNYVSDNNATIEKDGTKTAKCDRCDATDSIPDDRNPGKEAVNEVIAKIDTIKAVTEDDAERVAEVRKAYDELPDQLKPYVTNYDVLTEAEAKIQEQLNAYKCPVCGIFFENYGRISSNRATEVIFSVLHIVFHEACHALEYFASAILGIFSF